MSTEKLAQLEARIARLERRNELRLALQFDGIPIPGTNLTLRGRGDGFADVEDDQPKANGFSMHSTFLADIIEDPALVAAVKEVARECGLRSVQALHGFIGISAEEMRGEETSKEPLSTRLSVPVDPLSVPGAKEYFLRPEDGPARPTAKLLFSPEGSPHFSAVLSTPKNRAVRQRITAFARSIGIARIRCIDGCFDVPALKKEKKRCP